ncbi:hypothetical protein FGE12_05885 [Aggregicoccus sp. 17bor-14]|uniref:hypothetical protein n=1 Tax=Myxococcaceae TaxID=31 RepID=UPI00129C69C4|nr:MULTISPECIES: hypothetical protein [Myxococcaceae]MBF5041914.1 hypothetical protein [Simulacricoccus sp. 17bor-14]MRI87695.1 hypothetical protein [Aggregicoccus sp. 17bor-14]
MTLPAVLFALAALGGVFMAALVFRGRAHPPLGIAVVHGLAAAAGLVVLLLAVMGGQAPGLAKTALVLFVLAALGGFVLFAMHLQRKALPRPVVAVHGLVAVVAFAVLLVAILRPGS